jgi:hypothetical protein
MTAAAAEVELWRSGQTDRLPRIEALLDQVAQRQIGEQAAEGGFFGHFRAWKDSCTSEKSCSHRGGFYGEAQCVPHWLVPFADMARLLPDHPAAGRWRRVVSDFVYGYLLPGCRANPFLLLPNGYYQHPESSGLQWFSAQWHGRNGTFGFAAALALELADFLKEPELVEVAHAQLQWIAGLNVGLPATQADQQAGLVFGTSMIFGVGHRYVGGWAGTHGRIANGFASGREFVVLPPSAGDRPDFPIHSRWEEMPTMQPVGLPPLRGSEEYIVHSGGWLSGISRWRDLAMRTEERS